MRGRHHAWLYGFTSLAHARGYERLAKELSQEHYSSSECLNGVAAPLEVLSMAFLSLKGIRFTLSILVNSILYICFVCFYLMPAISSKPVTKLGQWPESERGWEFKPQPACRWQISDS